MVATCFVIGIVASLIADKRDPESDAKRVERAPGKPAPREPDPAGRR